jgi:GNAT superfamily N-acetyltransferase
MLSEQTIVRIMQFWAGHLGCSAAVLRDPGVKVLGGARPGTMFIFRYQDACLWQVHADSVASTVAILDQRLPVAQAFSEGFVRNTIGPALNRLLGPCPLGYCDARTFRRDAVATQCRQLIPSDHAEVDDLARACGAEAWEHGGVDLPTQPAVFGYFEGGRLVAAASYEIWGSAIAHVGVATAPDWRGRGLGKIVATAATADALERGLVPQWRTLASNVASVSVGRAIGYQPVAAHFFAGLRST